jgi:hypothetical protein
VDFRVPQGGGDVDVTLSSGESLKFEFPASAAGLDVTLTPESGSTIGWSQFPEVIRMEPDGTTFDDPIVIKPSSKNVLVFDFPTSAQKSPAEGLALNGSGDGLLLEHFSTLVVVPPDVSCTSQSGWNATDNDERCSEFAPATTGIEYTCKAYEYCLIITARCCATQGKDACELGMDDLTLRYQPADTNGGQYPYCDRGNGGTGGTSGQGGTAGQGGVAGQAAASGSAGASTGGVAGAAGAGAGGAATGGAATGGAGAGTSGTAGTAGTAGNGPGCFAPGTEASPQESGSCASFGDAYFINLSNLPAGTVRSHSAASGTSTWDAAASSSACVSAPARTDVYRVSPFIGWNTVEVTAESTSATNDVRISFLDSDFGCVASEVSCVNGYGANHCEYGSATFSQLNTNAIFVVVSSAEPSSVVTASFRVQ